MMSMPIERIIEQPAVSDKLSADTQQTLAESGFYWRERDRVRVLVCRALESAGFANGFSTRLGGVSPFPSGDLNLAGFNEDSRENIYENRRRFLAAFDSPYRLALAYQVHGEDIRVITSEDDAGDSDERADAVVSGIPGILAGVKTADCVPVLIGDPVKRAFAAVHAGWRGTAQSIAAKTVTRMAEIFGSDPGDLISAIGPAAGCDRYEVGEDVIGLFGQNFSTSGKYFTETRPGHAFVDLKLANRDQLASAGVVDEKIFTSPYCTMERTDLFFSYRIEKKKYGRSGRLLSVIGLAGQL
jgi:YfiH family protein